MACKHCCVAQRRAGVHTTSPYPTGRQRLSGWGLGATCKFFFVVYESSPLDLKTEKLPLGLCYGKKKRHTVLYCKHSNSVSFNVPSNKFVCPSYTCQQCDPYWQKDWTSSNLPNDTAPLVGLLPCPWQPRSLGCSSSAPPRTCCCLGT